jgi:Ni/Fe-hydrogenase 1 B-type cytochrome subunit
MTITPQGIGGPGGAAPIPTGPGTIKVVKSRKPLHYGEGIYHWVYLWHLPIRVTHWFSATAILVLCITGLYIANPYLGTSGEPSAHFMMGWMRFIHFTAASVLVAAAILRVYWLFFGNQYESWKALLPLTWKDWKNTWWMLYAYLFVKPEKAPHYLGHNPLQQLNYTLLYFMAIVEIVTGFAMYGLADTGGIFYSMFGWVGPLFGGWQMVRLVHHALMWFFIMFLPLHVYLAVRAAMMDRSGTLSSIFTGGRFVRQDVPWEDATFSPEPEA